MIPGGTVSRGAAFRVWVRVAIQSFGGPAGQIAVVHRLVVEERGWLDETRFLHALSYCMLLPGPEAQQLATYVGWLLHGVRGGLVAGLLFIAPGFLSILGLSVLYAGYGDVGAVAALFYGLKPAVIAVVLEAVVRLKRRALTHPTAGLMAGAAFLAIFAFHVPFPLIVAGAAGCGMLWMRGARPADVPLGKSAWPSFALAGRTALLWALIWMVPVFTLLILLGPDHLFVQEGIFFSKTAVVTFGGAYTVLAYVAQRAVETYHWLLPGQMLDGLGLAETTPGPLIQVVQFVGFLGAYGHPGTLPPMVAGVLGSLLTAWVTFAPCFLFIFVGAPFVERLRQHPGLSAALRGITAAVVGVVLNLAVWLGLHTLFGEVSYLDAGPLHLLVPRLGTVDWPALGIAGAALLAMFRWKVGMLPTLGGAAVTGVLIRLL